MDLSIFSQLFGRYFLSTVFMLDTLLGTRREQSLCYGAQGLGGDKHYIITEINSQVEIVINAAKTSGRVSQKVVRE